jgi:hypothetical protein
MPSPIDLSAEIANEWVPNHEIALPADARVFRPETLTAVVAGRFERRHARNIAGYLEGCPRVLEIGAGVGFLPIRVIQISQGLTVMAQDTRKELIALGKQIATRAGLDNTARLKWTDGPLRFPTDEGAEASGLKAYLRDFRPTALRLNRPADVPPDVLAAQDLGTVTRVVVPFVSDEQAAEWRAGYAPVLAAKGFTEADDRAGGGSLQFDLKTP